MKKLVSSLQKGLDILCCFGFDEETFSARKISRRLNIPLSTTYRYLETLEERGFLTKDSDNENYRLEFMFFQVGDISSLQMNLVNVAVPHMKSLASLSGETVLLTIISGWKTLCIERIEASNRVKFTLERGSSLPLHAGAPSKILLAYQKDSFIDYFLKNVVLTKYTYNTITDPILLRKELRTIREQGFALSKEEVDLGAFAIAAPVFYNKGKVAAGIAVGGPAERVDNENKLPLIQMVKNAADRISYDFVRKEII
jgi:DNA-binding IclR family transcriptional regulator